MVFRYGIDKDDEILLKKIHNMPNLPILVKSQEVITIFTFNFAHGGHFENMQIRIIYGFGYITRFWASRKIINISLVQLPNVIL